MAYLLQQLIKDSSTIHPSAEAVRFKADSLTYAELERISSQLANTLIAAGIKKGDRVGIYMSKSIESPIAMYGIMKAGGAYVPLDPNAPISRLQFVIQDCGIRCLVTNSTKQMTIDELVAGTNLETVIGFTGTGSQVDWIEWDAVTQADIDIPELGLTEQDLAYILYTSGSTGMPKGIMHTHRSGLSFAEWAADTYRLTHEDRVSNHAPLHFDLSTFDYFAAAVAGATTVIIPEPLTKFPADMAKLIEREKISVWYSVPFALTQMLKRGSLESRDTSALRWMLFAGEVFPTKHLQAIMQLLPDTRFSNLYGPTETNVCTYYHVEKLPDDLDETIPIGLPCSNVDHLILDTDDAIVAPGEVGELVIRGGVVMAGYWGQAERTRDSFFRRPVFGYLEESFYRTGDLVSEDPDGNIRYYGRKDRQIKTRGYRVELDEVESALLAHNDVEEAAAYPVPDLDGSQVIEASVVPVDGQHLDQALLLDVVSETLPTYAVPTRIQVMENFPRTSTGKIDRRMLQKLSEEMVAENET